MDPAGHAQLAERVAVAGAVVAGLLLAALVPASAAAQQPGACRVICGLGWKFEPTFTIESLGNRHTVLSPAGLAERAERERVFEVVLALDLETKLRRLGFTVEAITSPFSDDNEVELEFETNVHWLTERMTRGWVTSHVDVVDQLSPAERPHDRRAYTHKLDFELDTAVHPFKRLPDGRWLKGLEIETSLDYLATGTPRRGDIFPDGSRFLDDASRWSLSFVIVVPIAPF